MKIWTLALALAAVTFMVIYRLWRRVRAAGDAGVALDRTKPKEIAF